MDAENKTLQNNKIAQFILRIDMMPGTTIDFKGIAEALSLEYGSVRTELHVNYNVDMQKVEVNKEEFITYILGKASGVTLRMDCFEKSIVLSCSHYDNNTVYKDRLHKLIDLLKQSNPDAMASRVGMRYINRFPCSKPSDISKYFNNAEANSIKETLKRDNVSRAILVHEYQRGDFQARVQCGVPNKFYPSVITNYELVLDIDVYGVGAQPIDRWEESISDYNHGAYGYFVNYVKPTMLAEMR